MGILADWQIKEQVKIVPWTDCESRPGKISYGCSSYGFDARTGYRFQVFTPNPHANVVVDPKAFDKRALVDVDLTPTVGHDWGCDPHHGWVCRRCDKGLGEDRTPAPAEVTDYTGTCVNTRADHIIIPPHSFALAETLEHVEIPRDVLCVVVGKSTYARCGIIVPLTPLEPEWRGKVTVEIGNTTPLPAKVYAGEGIMQLLFFRTDGVEEGILRTVRRLCSQQVRESLHGQTAGDPHAACLQDIEELLHRDLGRSTCRVSYKDKKGRYQDQTGIVHPTVDDAPRTP